MTELTLVIGNQNYSSWSLRPWLFLVHHAIPFKTRKVSLFTDSMERDLAVHFSDNKVPVLIDGELEVWDSLAILEYLVERFPETRAGRKSVLPGRWPARSAPRCTPVFRDAW